MIWSFKHASDKTEFADKSWHGIYVGCWKSFCNLILPVAPTFCYYHIRGRIFLCDEFREGRPSTSVATNVDAVREMIERDRHMTYREIQASLGIDMKAIHTILHDHLSVRKLCSRWIPHNLIEAQKQARVKWSKEMLKKFNRGRSNLVYNIVTGDETWIYSYEPESKQQSTDWVFQNESKPTKVVRSRSAAKQMIACFFSYIGIWQPWL
ncbi:PREDICTED: uncharacterized protein LOC105151689 [Acromyrmex echinatior]|uniref:uncharacterized protein LOC105151689 n=1 Tax=Acromyrmex echinatior TaxID=103372 RepID=UPI00058109CC|nr:PREDICTED: uncharacterized protein LOC105151689 [Acromyrmex echinatior]